MTRSRRGNFAILTALTLMGLLGMAAVSIDTSWLVLTRQQAEVAAEAASLAGASALDGTEEGIELAVSRAIVIGDLNQVGGVPVTLSPNDIVFGHWNEDTRELESVDVEEVDAIAVRVRVAIPSLLGEIVTAMTATTSPAGPSRWAPRPGHLK
jgi:Flp pilus assembly protein TadG